MSDENSMTEEKELSECRVRVECWKGGNLEDVVEGKAIVGAVVTDDGQHAIAIGRINPLDVITSGTALVSAYRSMASGIKTPIPAKAVMLAGLMHWEDGEHE